MQSEKEKDIVVFIVRRNTRCSDCDEELGSGSFIYLEDGQPLCLSCADLDHLDYLPSGNTALTRPKCYVPKFEGSSGIFLLSLSPLEWTQHKPPVCLEKPKFA